MAGAPLPELTEEELARYNQIKTQRQAQAPQPMSAQEFETWYQQNVASPNEQQQYQQEQWKQFQQTPVGQMAPERGLSGGSFPGFAPTVRQAAGQPTYGYTAPKTPNYVAIYLDGAGRAIRSGAASGQEANPAKAAYSLVDGAYMQAKGYVDDRGNLTPEGESWVAEQVFWPYAVYRGAEDFVTYSDAAANSNNWYDWATNSLLAAGGFLGMYPGGQSRMRFRPKPMRTGYPAVGGIDPRTGKPRVEPRVDPETGQPLPDIEAKPVYRSHANDLLLDPKSPLAQAGDNPLTYRRWTELLIQHGATKEEVRWMTNEMRRRYGSKFDPQKTYITRQELAEVQYSSMPNLEVRAVANDPTNFYETRSPDRRPIPFVQMGNGTDGPYKWAIIAGPTPSDPSKPRRYYKIVTDTRGRGDTGEVQVSEDGQTWKHGWGYGEHGGAPHNGGSQGVMRDINNDYHRWRSSSYRSGSHDNWQDHQAPEPVGAGRRSDGPLLDPNRNSGPMTPNTAEDNYQVINLGLLDNNGVPIKLPQKPGHPAEANAIAFAPATDAVEQGTGKKILRVHEVQSDAEAAGRREGYGPRSGQAHPDMPYQSPREWTKAIVRALVSHAARNGYDGIQFPTWAEVKGRWGERGGTKEQYERWLPHAVEEVSKELGIPPSQITSTQVSGVKAARSSSNLSPATRSLGEMGPRLEDFTNEFDTFDYDQAVVDLQEMMRRPGYRQENPGYVETLDLMIREFDRTNAVLRAQGQRPMQWESFVDGLLNNAPMGITPTTGSGFRFDQQTRRRIVEGGLRISRMDPEQSGEEPSSAYG